MSEQVENKTTLQHEENKIYELGFLLSPSLPEEKLGEAVSVLKSVIEKQSGIFISEEFPKLRPLLYTMVQSLESRNQRFNSAYFGWLKFEVHPSSVQIIEQAVKANLDVIRFLLITTVRENTLASLPRMTYGKPTADFSPKSPVSLETKTEVSEVELDKSLEKLVI